MTIIKNVRTNGTIWTTQNNTILQIQFFFIALAICNAIFLIQTYKNQLFVGAFFLRLIGKE